MTELFGLSSSYALRAGWCHDLASTVVPDRSLAAPLAGKQFYRNVPYLYADFVAKNGSWVGSVPGGRSH